MRGFQCMLATVPQYCGEHAVVSSTCPIWCLKTGQVSPQKSEHAGAWGGRAPYSLTSPPVTVAIQTTAATYHVDYFLRCPNIRSIGNFSTRFEAFFVRGTLPPGDFLLQEAETLVATVNRHLQKATGTNVTIQNDAQLSALACLATIKPGGTSATLAATAEALMAQQREAVRARNLLSGERWASAPCMHRMHANPVWLRCLPPLPHLPAGRLSHAFAPRRCC